MNTPKQSILIVDDTRFPRVALEKALLRLFPQFNVLVAVDGAQGLNSFSQNRDTVVIVITDYDMPEMNGAQLAKEIRMIDQKIGIIMSSSHPQNSEELAGAPVNAYLQKPYGLEELEDCVNSVLSNTGRI